MACSKVLVCRMQRVGYCPMGQGTATPPARSRIVSLPSCLRFDLFETVIQRVAGPAHGADRVLQVAGIEEFPQPSDVNVHGTLVDIDVAAPDAVEQLLPA